MSLVETVRTQLAELADLYALLPMYRLPGSLPPDPDARRATTNPSRPTVVLEIVALTDERDKPHSDGELGVRDTDLDRRAGGRRQGILPTLGMWVSMVSAELIDFGEDVDECCPTRKHTVAGECAWLVKYAARVLELHHDFVDDVAWMHRDLRKAVGERDERGPVLRCLKAGCGWTIESVDDGSWFRCTGCGKAWGRMEVHRMSPKSLPELAVRAKVHVRTLQRKVAAARLEPVGISDDGERLFRPYEVERLVSGADSCAS